MASVSAVDWVFLARDAVEVGDNISAEAGGMPIYQVVAVEDGQAWVRDERGPNVLKMPLDRFCWKIAS